MNKFCNHKAVIWAMDGVIVDSGLAPFPILAKHSGPVFSQCIRVAVAPDVWHDQQGGVRILFGADVKEEFVTQLCEEKELLFRSAIKESAAYLPGVERWLSAFKQAGIRQTLASSGSQENSDTVLDALGTRSFLDEVVSGKNLPSKPDPAVFLLAAQRLGVQPKACLVIEDAIAGVTGAKSAGMKCLVVTTTNSLLDLSNADVILENLASLSGLTLRTLFP